jgi:hypothetical protein
VRFAWAAIRPGRELVVPLCGPWAAALHLRLRVARCPGVAAGNGAWQDAAHART